eukprot:317257_1
MTQKTNEKTLLMLQIGDYHTNKSNEEKVNKKNLIILEKSARIFGSWIHYERSKWVNIVAYLLCFISIVMIGIHTYNKIKADWKNFKSYFTCLVCIARILWFRFKYYPIWNDTRLDIINSNKLNNFFSQNSTQQFYKIQLAILSIYSLAVIINTIWDITLHPFNIFHYFYQICRIWCYKIVVWITVTILEWYCKMYSFYLQLIYNDLIEFKNNLNEDKLDQIISDYKQISKRFIDDTQNNLKYLFEILLMIIVIATIWDNVARSITFWHVFYSISYVILAFCWFYSAKHVNDENKKINAFVLEIIEEIRARRCDEVVNYNIDKSRKHYLLTQMNILYTYCNTIYSCQCKIGGIKVTKWNVTKMIGLFIIGKIVSYLYAETQTLH